MKDFYPRPPRGGRQESAGYINAIIQFLSTPSARRATEHADHRELHGDISIHALREEGDSLPHSTGCGYTISIHALREEGDTMFASSMPSILNFYPRPPRGGRPARGESQGREHYISIHALREEGDRQEPGADGKDENFYPRPPRGGRPL